MIPRCLTEIGSEPDVWEELDAIFSTFPEQGRTQVKRGGVLSVGTRWYFCLTRKSLGKG